MPVDEQEQGVVPSTVAPILGSVEELRNLVRTQVILPPLVGVYRLSRRTLYTSTGWSLPFRAQLVPGFPGVSV